MYVVICEPCRHATQTNSTNRVLNISSKKQFLYQPGGWRCKAQSKGHSGPHTHTRLQLSDQYFGMKRHYMALYCYGPPSPSYILHSETITISLSNHVYIYHYIPGSWKRHKSLPFQEQMPWTGVIPKDVVTSLRKPTRPVQQDAPSDVRNPYNGMLF